MIFDQQAQYGLDCTYFTSTFDTLGELIQAVIHSGQDPNCEIQKDGIGIGETAWDHIQE